MYNKFFPHKRYRHTIDFLKEVIPSGSKILDLGISNPLSEIMTKEGYSVENTNGEDLDEDFSSVQQSDAEVVTAFEIFEHLVAPFNILKEIKATKIVVTVPLRLWFATAYRSKTDPWDRHYHEFEDWQFDWLLEKAGWDIVKTKKWTNPSRPPIAPRPILRHLIPRYYAVYAERKASK
ncbi:methyltransferase [Kordia sp.]|uniref:methyltransferase n=1 Tax=Kordia sp. TaxID=1965332 RepID=UPI003D29C11D